MEGEGQTERGGVEEAKKAWLRRERLLTPVFWPGEFHGWYSPWGAKSRTQLSDFRIPHTMLSAGRGRGTLSLLHFLLGTPRDHDAHLMAEISRGARGTQSPLSPVLGLCHHHPPPTRGQNPPAGASPLTPPPSPPEPGDVPECPRGLDDP